MWKEPIIRIEINAIQHKARVPDENCKDYQLPKSSFEKEVGFEVNGISPAKKLMVGLKNDSYPSANCELYSSA